MARQGVMLYFDLLPSLQRLSDEEKGRLFVAIIEYASGGVLPDFDNDIALSIAFDFVRPRIDADADRYEQKCEQAREAINARWNRDTNEYGRIRTNTDNTNTTQPSSTQLSSTQHNTTQLISSQRGGDIDCIIDNKGNPPTLDEIKSYCDRESIFINCDLFYDCLSAKDWKENGAPVNWKEKAKTWHK